MLIANPIYDSAFKYLMNDKRVAEHFLSVLLNREIILEEFTQTENAQPNLFAETGFSSQRLDFKATIIDQNGKSRKVLIELQKNKRQMDLGRFRRYLANNYYDSSLQQDAHEHTEIISIYILGFSLNIPVAVVRTSNQLIDASTQEPLEITTDDENFIRKLHHESLFIDITKISTKMRTRVDRLLSIFNQEYSLKQDAKNNSNNLNNLNHQNYNYNYALNLPDELIANTLQASAEDYYMIERLNMALLPEDVRSTMISEQEFHRELESMIKKNEAEKFIEGAEKGFEQGIEQGIEQGLQKGIEQGKIDIAKNMLRSGLDAAQVAQFTGLDIQTVQNIFNKI